MDIHPERRAANPLRAIRNSALRFRAAGVGADELGLGDQVLDLSEGFQAGMSGAAGDLFHYWSHHPGGSQFAMCDGSVRFLLYSIDQPAFRALGSRYEGELVSDL